MDNGQDRHDATAEPSPDETDDHPLPPAVVDEAEQLTRQARDAVDDNEATAYREARAELLSEYDYRARIREDDRTVLVLYPDEWMADGTVQLDEIEDIDRGIERPLDGPGNENWESTENHNRALADDVETAHGAVHGANAHALADFMSNHYAKQVERATGEEITEFLDDYFPRNAWPSEEQRRVVETSIEYVFECAGTDSPTWN